MLPFQVALFFAERMGFEPTMQLPTYKLSRLAPSATRTPLLVWVANNTKKKQFTKFKPYFFTTIRPLSTFQKWS